MINIMPLMLVLDKMLLSINSNLRNIKVGKERTVIRVRVVIMTHLFKKFDLFS